MLWLMAENPGPDDLLRALPAVQKLMEHASLRSLDQRFGREAVISCARAPLAEVRQTIREGRAGSLLVNGSQAGLVDFIAGCVSARVERRCASGVQKVINATGVILHTGLG